MKAEVYTALQIAQVTMHKQMKLKCNFFFTQRPQHILISRSSQV